MCGAVSRRGLPRGSLSRSFSAAELQDAARDDPQDTVYVDVDAEGYLMAGGGAGAGGGAARAAVRARAAPHVAACDAVLCRAAPHGPPRLRLRLLRAVPPLHELRLWFDEELLAAINMPFLTLGNIRGRKDYECHECGARFEEPNPLKTHLFLSCTPSTPSRFWRLVAARLQHPPDPTPPLSSAFHRVAPTTAAAGSPPPPPLPSASTLSHPTLDALAAARLEALATEWGRGRGRGGHACLYCGKLYSRKYGLKIHIRTHTGYRPLRCAHCGRAFGDPSNLNKHLRLHAAAGGAGRAGGHACRRCGKALARRRDLERHLRAPCAAPAPAPAPAPTPTPRPRFDL